MDVTSSRDLSISATTFFQCEAEAFGGAIHAYDVDTVSAEGASFIGCTAHQSILYTDEIERLVLTDSRFVDNVAAIAAAIYFTSSVAVSDSTLSNTTFLRNTALGNVTILAASPLTWDCPLGSWMPNVGQFFGDMTRCTELCSEGHYGNVSDHFTSSCTGPCWPGHFCPEGTVVPQSCPAGSTRMPNRRAASESDCMMCAPGTFQQAEGSTECEPCPAGTFSLEDGATSCELCPAGGYCDEAGAATSTIWKACPAGSFNEHHGSSSPASCLACPLGTSSPNLGANSSRSCELCGAEAYAPSPKSECKPCPHLLRLQARLLPAGPER